MLPKFDTYEVRALLAVAVIVGLPVVLPVITLVPADWLGRLGLGAISVFVLYGFGFSVAGLGRRAQHACGNSGVARHLLGSAGGLTTLGVNRSRNGYTRQSLARSGLNCFSVGGSETTRMERTRRSRTPSHEYGRTFGSTTPMVCGTATTPSTDSPETSPARPSSVPSFPC